MGTSQQLQSFMVPGSSYGYTGAPVDTLQSFENTLAQALLDESSSTGPFSRQMELCVKEIVKALRRSTRADYLIYRQNHFATEYREHHGFTPLAQINVDDYDGCYRPGGRTTLYDSADRVIRELVDYAQQQAKLKYQCNGVIFIVTDGVDFGSTLRAGDVKKTLTWAAQQEDLESLMTFLIGVNDDDDVQRNLQAMQASVGFTGYIPLGKADERSLAKLGNWIVSQSVAQSQAIGSGGPSQSLKF